MNLFLRLSDENAIDGIPHLKFTVQSIRSFKWYSWVVLLRIQFEDETRFKDDCWSQVQEFVCSKFQFIVQVMFSFHEHWLFLLWLMIMLTLCSQLIFLINQLDLKFILFLFTRVLKLLQMVSNAMIILFLSNYNSRPPFV